MMLRILSPLPPLVKLLLGGLGIFALIWLLSAAPVQAASMNNRAEQQETLAVPPPQVLSAAKQAFEQWQRGEWVSTEEENMRVIGLSRTNFFKFTDDITVSLQPVETDPNQTQIEIRSVGRVGEYDFGGNQRNIDEYMAALRQILNLSQS